MAGSSSSLASAAALRTRKPVRRDSGLSSLPMRCRRLRAGATEAVVGVRVAVGAQVAEPQEETVRSSGRMCFHPQGEQDYSGDVTAGLPIVTSNHLAR